MESRQLVELETRYAELERLYEESEEVGSSSLSGSSVAIVVLAQLCSPPQARRKMEELLEKEGAKAQEAIRERKRLESELSRAKQVGKLLLLHHRALLWHHSCPLLVGCEPPVI